MNGRWRDTLLLMAVVVAVYANSLGGGFHYDDFHSIVLNPHIRDLGRIPGFFAEPGYFSVDAEKAMYRPLLLVSYAVNFAVGGLEALGYHLFNLAVHLVCVMLVWRLAADYGRGSALCAGLVFALHPVATEPVNYISSRSESMTVAFMLAAMVLNLRGGTKNEVGGLLCFAAGLLVKSIAIVLPGLLVLVAYKQHGQRIAWRRLAAYGVVSVVYLTTIVANRFLGESLANAPRGLASQLFTQCKGLVFYAKMLLFPVGLNVEPQFDVASVPWSGAVLASVAFLGSGVYLGLRSRTALVFLGWVLLGLMPTIVVPLNVLVNEHRLYLPLAGLALGAGIWWSKAGGGRLLWVGLACLSLWGGLAVQRNAQWKSELSLWTAAADGSPQMPRVYVHLGNALRDAGRSLDARKSYERALVLDPDSRPARTNLGNLYYEAAQADSARRTEYLAVAVDQYEEVLVKSPDYWEALNNLGSALMGLGDLRGAKDAWQRAQAAHPNHAEAHFNMGLLLARTGSHSAAIDHFDRALALGEDPEILLEKGHVLVAVRRLDEAAAVYRRKVALDPKDAASRHNLAQVLLAAGEDDIQQGFNSQGVAKWREARAVLVELLQLQPHHNRAQMRLAQLEERLR